MAAPDPQPRRILLVDDHEDTLALEAMLLRRAGYEVVTAANAAQALALAGQEAVDLVVADIRLPDRSGLDLMRDLHARHGLRGIALTGAADPELVAAGREAGFLQVLLKPVLPEDLTRTIGETLATLEQGEA